MHSSGIVWLVILACLAAKASGSDKSVPNQLADGRLITSPSNLIGGLSQLKLVAGYASNATLTPPSTGFKYVQCAVSYGTWIFQIQAETHRALSKASSDRQRIRIELEGVKQALYGLLGHRDADKQAGLPERRRAITRYQQTIADNIRKAVQAAEDALKNLNPPKLMLEEMEGALPTSEVNSKDESCCREDPLPVGQMHPRHKAKAIALLKETKDNWASIIELHRYLQQRVARDIDQGEKPLLEHRIDLFLKDEASTTQDLQMGIAPIVQRMLKNIGILKAIEDAYAAQNMLQRYAKTPIISARRNDVEICREYNRMAGETVVYNQKAREALSKSLGQ